MGKVTGILVRIFDTESLFLSTILILLVPALMCLIFPVRSFVWASRAVRLVLPPFGRVIYDGTIENIGTMIVLDAIPFTVFTATLFSMAKPPHDLALEG